MKKRIEGVTLVCTNDARLEQTLVSLDITLSLCEFDNVVLLTSMPIKRDYVRPVPPMKGGIADCSKFRIREMYKYFSTPHALIVEADSWVCAPDKWDPEWLAYDYVGGVANWTEPGEEGKGGNGGFSLRSHRLCALSAQITPAGSEHPEDTVLSAAPGYRSSMRDAFEKAGMRFAPRRVQREFSVDDSVWKGSFGHHKCADRLATLGWERWY